MIVFAIIPRCPISGAKRKTFARVELFRFSPEADIEPDQVIRRHEPRTCGGLLFLKMPRAVPTFAGRSRDQPVYALRLMNVSVVRRQAPLLARFKCATCVVPALHPVCGEPLGETIAQFKLRSRQLALGSKARSGRMR